MLEGDKHLSVSAIRSLDWHLGNIDRFLFDQILLVDIAQAPWLNKFVWKLSMKKHTALLDAPRDPGFEGRLRSKIVYVLLLKFKCKVDILLRTSLAVSLHRR